MGLRKSKREEVDVAINDDEAWMWAEVGHFCMLAVMAPAGHPLGYIKKETRFSDARAVFEHYWPISGHVSRRPMRLGIVDHYCLGRDLFEHIQSVVGSDVAVDYVIRRGEINMNGAVQPSIAKVA